MLVLGLDTATWVASVGVTRDEEPLAEESCRAASSHTEILFPLIARVLARAEVSLAEVNGLGVSIGPGSFTGLRVALGTVKGFAYALGHKIVGVPTLDARKREVYAALFHRDQQGMLHKLTSDLVLAPQALLERITAPCLFLGD